MKRRVIGWSAFGVVFCTGFYYLGFLRQSGRPTFLALEVARESPAVTESPGGTNLKREFVTGRIISGPDYGNADLTIHVAGPIGSGTLLEWAQNGFQGWHICSLIFRTEPPRHDVVLVDDALTTCERECELGGNVAADSSASLRNDKQKGRQRQEQGQRQPQILPLRFGMTNKRAGKARATTTATADSSAALRNDKQKGRARQSKGSYKSNDNGNRRFLRFAAE